MCCTCPCELSEVVAASLSSSSHQIDRPTTPVVLSAYLSLTRSAHTVQVMICSQPSAFQASKHAGQVQVGAGRVWQHACMCIVAVVAHGASLAIKVSIPPVVSILGQDSHVQGHHAPARRSLDTGDKTRNAHSQGADGHGPRERWLGHASAQSGPSFTPRL